jgi:hypothetical protein
MRIQNTSQGEEILLEPSPEARKFKIKVSFFWIALSSCFFLFCGKALLFFFETETLTHPLAFLYRMDLETNTLRWLIRLATGCMLFFFSGAMFDILLILRKQDRIVLSFGEWVSERRRILVRKRQYRSGSNVRLVIDSFDGALIAKDERGSWKITELGTREERQEVAAKIRSKYGLPEGLPEHTRASETVATYRVTYNGDGSVTIQESLLARFGCASLLAAAMIGLIAHFAVQMKLAAVLVLPLFLLPALAVAIMTYNRRIVDASPGYLRIRKRELGGFGVEWLRHTEAVYRKGFLVLRKITHKPARTNRRVSGTRVQVTNELWIFDPESIDDPGADVLKFTSDPGEYPRHIGEILSRVTGFDLKKH